MHLRNSVKAGMLNYVKNIQKLRLVIIFLVVMVVQAKAEVFSQLKISLSVENASVETVFNIIRLKTGLDFVYTSHSIENAKKVSINANLLTIEQVMDQMVKNQDFTYIILEKTIIIKAKEDSAVLKMPVQQLLKGVVRDMDGKPLEGVDIRIQGKQVSAISDANGAFAIEAGNNSVLVLSLVGYKTREIKIKNQNLLQVQLEEEVNELNQVVVVGYGSAKRKDLTGSITSVKSEELNKGVVRDPILALQGKVPGLNITKDGSPYGSASVILRGVSTFRAGEAQQPLIVVDGLPNGLMPAMDDVASIDVLKDASATSIYGSRGANGVIMVTTKKAKAGTQSISVNSFVALESISNKIDMLTAEEYRAYVAKNGLSILPTDEHNVNTDWTDKITRTGVSTRNNISIIGGYNKTKYSSSIEHFKNEGIINGTSLERVNMRGSLEQTALNDKLKLQFMLAGTSTKSQMLIDQGEVLWNSLVHQPTRTDRAADGSFLERETAPYNPVALIEQHKNDGVANTLLGNIRAEVKILPNLDYVLNTSMNISQNNTAIYFSKYSRLRQGSNGEAIRSSYESRSKVLETFFSYKTQINKHYIGAIGGYSWQEDRYGDGFQSSNINFVTDDVSYYNLRLGSGATGYIPLYGTTTMKTLRMISFYGRLNYEFNNRFLFQAAVRKDGSSAFGVNNRWGTFPSASVGWRLGEEKAIKKLNVFDDLKLRAGYGASGNSLGFDPLISMLRYGTAGSFYNNGVYITGITPTQNQNPDLKWERTDMLNIGIDYSILKGRVSGTIEYYKKKTSDLIWTYSVPASQYYVNTILANVGEMENKGFEFSINTIPVKNKGFEWNSSFNIAFNNNKILSLTNDKYQLDYIDYYGVGKHGQSGNMAFKLKAGYPVGQFSIWEYAGQNAAGVSQFLSKTGALTISPSSLDRKITKENAQPKFIAGWFNRISYQRWNLEFLIRGVAGNTILNATRADLNYPTEILRYNVSKEALNEKVNNTTANYTSTRYLEKGDYARMDNITLSYSPKLSTNHIKSLRIYTTVNNAFIITKYKGIDPEVNMSGLTPGIDDSNIYPKTRSFVLGINVQF